MLVTSIVFAVFFGLTVLQISLWAVGLYLGLRWAKVADITWRRTLRVTLVAWGMSFVVVSLSYLPKLSPSSRDILLFFLAGALFLMSLFVISRAFKVGFVRSFIAWLPTLVPSIALTLFTLLVVRPFIFEAFTTATNQMAPTILGDRSQSTCAICGKTNFCLPANEQTGEPRKAICASFHITDVTDVDPQVIAGDRFLVAKFIAPKRWDIIAFKFPPYPDRLIISRLVGMPGETIRIEHGEVFANDTKLIPPKSLEGISYVSGISGDHIPDWGSVNHPAVLGEDEHFVIGDFSTNSYDSRLWDKGAEGHNPFAVPKSYIQGVVTHIYWPPERWRVLQ